MPEDYKGGSRMRPWELEVALDTMRGSLRWRMPGLRDGLEASHTCTGYSGVCLAGELLCRSADHARECAHWRCGCRGCLRCAAEVAEMGGFRRDRGICLLQSGGVADAGGSSLPCGVALNEGFRRAGALRSFFTDDGEPIRQGGCTSGFWLDFYTRTFACGSCGGCVSRQVFIEGWGSCECGDDEVAQRAASFARQYDEMVARILKATKTGVPVEAPLVEASYEALDGKATVGGTQLDLFM